MNLFQMNKRSIFFLLFCFLVYSMIAVTPASAKGKDGCRQVRAKIESNIVTYNPYYNPDYPEDPYYNPASCPETSTCTVGKITRGGLLNGTTSFIAIDGADFAGMDYASEPFLVSYSGILTVETPRGTLTFRDVGVVDGVYANPFVDPPEALDVYTELDRITGGTGRFEGATGVLFISGNLTRDENYYPNGFTGKISGEICLVKQKKEKK